MFKRLLSALAISAFSARTQAEDIAATGTNYSALTIFILFVISTLAISHWAARRTHSSASFYTAGGQLSGAKNGTAIAGDFMSAASFLGISGLIFMAGYDGLILALGALSAWPIMLFLMSERVRNLGKYTLTDVVSYRLQQRPIRLIFTLGSLSVIIFYLIAQIVGAGKLIELLFGIPYIASVTMVGVLVIIYVTPEVCWQRPGCK